MKYRLGLDVGTASVGLVALELDGKDRPVKAVYQSVRIFAEPLQPAKKGGGVGEPKKAARRLARQQRRLHERRARQMKRIAQLARPMGLDPEKISADKGQRIHEKRALAATSRVSLEDLLRVFLKMAKRRGYYGGFKVKKDNKKGAVETGINELKAEMEKHQCETLGQYLWHRVKNDEHLRLKEEGLFADRQMLQDEFARIWAEQEKHHPVLKEKHREKSLRECFERAIVEQRPLKSPAPMTGNCSLEPMLPRAPMAQPVMQAFRIEKQIADLRWGSSRRAKSLSPEQREFIRKELQNKKEVKFTALYKALQKAGCPGPEGRELNLAHGDRETLTGDRTAGAMRTLKLQDKWEKMMAKHQISVINLLADMGSPEVFDAPEWDKNLMGSKGKERKIEPEVKEFIEAMLDTEKFGRLAKMGFDGGRASYSIKALEKLAAIMQKDGIDEHGAIEKAYPQNQAEQLNATLSSHDLTGNTVIDVALRQVRWEVNRAINKLGGPPAQIIIELSRDMKAGPNTRKKRMKKMRDNEKRNKIAAKEINRCTGGSATPSQIKRYLLWEEQGKKYCPYCSVPINLSAAINGNQTEYEHILPKSLTRIGKKRDFLVLAHKSCNQDKEDKTPWQTWGQDKERWKIIEERAKQFEAGYKATIDGKERTFKRKGKARQLLIKDFETEALDEELIGEFSERQFQESARIAKACGKWLRRICADVSVSRGLLTAHLRRTWGLDTVIPEVRYEEGMPVFDEDYQASEAETGQKECKISPKYFDKHRSYWEGRSTTSKDKRTTRRLNKRIDHRHHLVDALVIALTTPGLYQRMAMNYQQVSDAGKRKPRLRAEPGLKQDIRPEALRLVRDCSPRHKPDRWLGGNMFQDTAKAIKEENGKQFYVYRKDLSALKKGDIEKIVSETIRKEIEKEIKKRLEQGMTLEEALKKPIKDPEWNTPIRRVFLRGNEAKDAVKVEHGDRQSDLHKHLEPEGYAYLEFDSKQADSTPTLVRLHEAIKQGKQSTREDIVRFYKNDTVRDDKNGKCYIIKQFKEGRPSVFLCPITEAVADIGKVNAPRRKDISGKQIKRLTLAQDDCSSGSTG